MRDDRHLRVTTILPEAEPSASGVSCAQKLKVAAYCRVSTNSDEQLSSYQAQLEYYTEKIKCNPAWSLVAIYADQGISGISTKGRKEFNRMIKACRKGKIDLIITKSISRFSRNTLDGLDWTHLSLFHSNTHPSPPGSANNSAILHSKQQDICENRMILKEIQTVDKP